MKPNSNVSKFDETHKTIFCDEVSLSCPICSYLQADHANKRAQSATICLKFSILDTVCNTGYWKITGMVPTKCAVLEDGVVKNLTMHGLITRL